MTMKQLLFVSLYLIFFFLPLRATVKVYDMATFAGIIPDAVEVYDNSSRLSSALERIRRETRKGERVILKFKKGRYDFYATDARRYDLYISNHDNPSGRAVGFMMERFENITIDGCGSDFVFHGRMIPFYLKGGRNVVLKKFSIDFADPQICQVEVVDNSEQDGIMFRVADGYNHDIDEKGRFRVCGLDWALSYATGIAFEKGTRHIVYRTSDLGINLSQVHPTQDARILHAPNWKDRRLPLGTQVALRSYQRPCPGIVLDHCANTTLEHVTVHYAEGMGLVAQRCTDISLNQFNVCLRGKDDIRSFTTQADATHFSQCKGHIESVGGLYEGMMDDAINVHGIYLKIQELKDSHTIRASFEHEQCFGFPWGDVGDEVVFLRAKTMERVGINNRIKSIRPADGATFDGCKELLIELEMPYPAELHEKTTFGIENETWTPTVRFANSIVRNNRARGALFSSPRRTVCENNLFDHTSGTAILLCGDCNGWYESGPVRDLLIRKNKFVNALTNMFQFTNAVISIYPEIPNLNEQRLYFHGGHPGAICIENNEFHTFDVPLLYAKSVNGLIFRNNKVFKTEDYKPFHENKLPICLERVVNAQVEEAK